MKWLKLVIAVVVLALVAWWVWQRYFITDETRVKRLLATATSAVEKGNLIKLADVIAYDYSDDFGFDKSTLIGGVRSFRSEYNAIFIHLADLKITVEPDHVKSQAIFIAKVLAQPKGGGAQTEVRAERYRLFFRKTDQGWKLIRAESPQLKFD